MSGRFQGYASQATSRRRRRAWRPEEWFSPRAVSGWKGFHLAGGDFPAGAGVKIGVGFDHAIGSPDPDPLLPNRIDVTARAAYSTHGYARLGAGLNLRNLGGAPVDVMMSSQYYEFPQEDFFGIGPTSQEANRTDYLLESIDTGVAVRWRPALLDIGGGLSYLNPRIGQGTDSRFPSTGALFNPATIPGFVNQPDFIRGDASLAFDWRDNPAHPHRGGRYGVLVSQFHDQDLDAFDFRRVDIDLQQYVPLPNRYRLLALRAAAVLTDSAADQQVPFYFQPTLGGAQKLRSYLAHVIIRRRDKVVRWGITQTNPLDRFEVRAGSVPELRFDNAAARLGVVASQSRYRVQWSAFDNRSDAAYPSGDPITSTDRRFLVPDAAWGPADVDGTRYAVASIATLDRLFTHWATPVDVTIRDRNGLLDVVGIDRSPSGASNAPALRAGGAK